MRTSRTGGTNANTQDRGLVGCLRKGKETREAAAEGGKELIDVARGWTLGAWAKTLDFTLSEMRSHWWVWGRGVILSYFV